MITRRALVVVVALGLLAAPLAGDAQQRGKTWRVGFLSGGALTPEGGPPPALQQGLRELGYVEQKNVVYLARSANAKQDRLPALAAELVELKVDVIVTAGGPATAASRQATSTIPIVMATVGDADGLGLINSLAQRDFFNWGPLMAGATLGSIPVALVYFFFMDLYVGGLTAGAVKG